MTGATQLNSSLLTLSVIGVLLPAAFHNAVQPSNGINLTPEQEDHDILAISHGVCNCSHMNYSSQLTLHLPRLQLSCFSVSFPSAHRSC
jgi:Ca2+:H+ antiporter